MRPSSTGFPVRSSNVGIGLIIIAASLAGCVEGTASNDDGGALDVPTVAPPAQFDDTTGAVEGIVLDEEQQPIGGAQVGLLQASSNLSITTTSDLSGRFTFSQVQPGTYQLFAQQL